MFYVFLIFFSLFPLSLLEAQTENVSNNNEVLFRYNYQVGDQFRYEGFLYQEAYLNNKLVDRAESLSTVSAKVVNKKGEWATLENIYRQSVKNTQGLARLILLEESRYQQNELGTYLISMNYMFPAVRSIPTFPKKALKIGDKWESQGEEKFDLTWINAGKVASLLKVNYTYAGLASKEGKEYHKICLTYSPSIDKGIVSIRGNVKQNIYWDNIRGNIAYYEDEFVFSFCSGGNTYKYVGISNGKRVDKPKEELLPNWKEELAQELKRYPFTGHLMLNTDKDSLKIILQDIYFEPDSDYINEKQAEKLDKLAELLSRYPIYSLLIEGHTANIGTTQQQDRLSEERAYRVGEYLQCKGFKSQSPLLFKGWGSNKALYKGNDPQKSAQNRRVEVTILDN